MRRSRISVAIWEVAVILAFLMHLITAQVPVNSTTLSSPRTAVSSVSVGDRVLFVGGFDFHQKVASNKIDIFDAVNQTWIDPLSLPTSRGFVTPVVVDENIYFLGGISQDNPPNLYLPSNRSFVLMESGGPTVRVPKRLFLSNSTLTVVGSFSVDFYDMTSGNWSYNSNLTEVTMSLLNALVFAHQHYVFVIGGQQMSTNETSTTTWIFNRNTNELIKYENVTTANVTSDSSSFDVSNDVLVVRLSDRCLLYHLVRDEWHEELNAINAVGSLTLNDVTHLFGDNYVMYAWNGTFIPVRNSAFIELGFAIGDTIVLIRNGSMEVGGVKSNLPGFSITGSIRFAQPWGTTLYAFADDRYVYYFDGTSIWTLTEFADIKALFAIDDMLHVFDYNKTEGDTKWRRYTTSTGTEIFPVTLSDNLAPQAFVNNVFLDPKLGTMPITDATDIKFFKQFEGDIVTVQDGDTYILMTTTIPPHTQQQYMKMDVYNYINGTWTMKDMPEALFLPTNSKRFQETFMNAAAFNGSIMVWISGVYGVYDIKYDMWTIYTNTTLGTEETPIVRTRYLNNLHFQIPVIDDLAYVHHEEFKYFYKFAPDVLNWDKTLPTTIEENDPLLVQQPVAYEDLLFVSMRNNDNITYLYWYDTSVSNWQATILPSPSPFVAITVAGDYVIVVCSDKKLQIFSTTLNQWNTQELEYEVIPSTIIHVGNVTLIAGGTTASGLYSNTVLMVSDNVIFNEQVPVAPPGESSVPVDSTGSGLTLGELVAAIVVPIVVVLGAGLVVLLVLLRRRKRGKQTTTVGLEQQFGEWFTPFTDIVFGEQLGQGANGQVFKGKWKKTDVALKVSMTQANQSVIAELSLMINMRPHPNVVQLLGFSVHPETNSVILILEYCNGGSLDNQLMDDNALELPIDQKIQLLQGIARGVIHLHSNNIVHRDLAARNVLLHQGEPKLTDFGMSRIVDEEQQRGTTKSELGPIRWMSPESLSLKQYSTKSDVWSFGIVMFEVVSQQEPHLNADPITIGRQIRDEGLTPTIPPTCAEKLSSLMKQCWNRSAEKRPAMEEVLQQLEQM